MRLSQTSEYALRAVVHVATEGNGRAVPANEIADALDVPRNYLSKILDHLRQRGVLKASRGPGGGFRLALDPNDVSLADLIAPHDPISEERKCLLGRPDCLDADPCPVHDQWRELGGRLTQFFHYTTLAALLSDPPEASD